MQSISDDMQYGVARDDSGLGGLNNNEVGGLLTAIELLADDLKKGLNRREH